MILRQGMLPVYAGLIAGIATGLAVSRLIASQFYGVKPEDPWTIAFVSAALAVAGMAACWLPARRASRVDPLVALRSD